MKEEREKTIFFLLTLRSSSLEHRFFSIFSVVSSPFFRQSTSTSSMASSLRSVSLPSTTVTASRSAPAAATLASVSSPSPNKTLILSRRNLSSQVVAAVDEKVADWKKPSDKYSGFKYDFANSVSAGGSWRWKERKIRESWN